MNNGAVVRGPEGDTEGITEQRVNTWFTNRRKGLTTPVTPSPTRGVCVCVCMCDTNAPFLLYSSTSYQL